MMILRGYGSGEPEDQRSAFEGVELFNRLKSWSCRLVETPAGIGFTSALFVVLLLKRRHWLYKTLSGHPLSNVGKMTMP
jgi:hypothetical protein